MREKECIVLIIYDIVDNKQRNKMVKFLERYGVRVQYNGPVNSDQY